jgi:hypothetical protein
MKGNELLQNCRTTEEWYEAIVLEKSS